MRKHLGRGAAVLMSAALVGAAALAAGPVSAKNPGWVLTVTKLPAAVSSGQQAGYRVFIRNPGPSNINGLSIESSVAADVSYFSGLSAYETGPSSCSTSGQFKCLLGTLRPGQSTTFTIAYVTSGTGTFDVTMTLRSSSGDTGSDGGNSRGDVKTVTAKTGLSSSNFNGGYFPANTTVQTNQSLGSSNKQSTSLDGFNATSTNRYDVMVGDGSTSLPTDPQDPNFGLACVGAFCQSLRGEWSFVNLKEGQTQGAAFHVRLRVLGSLFGNPNPADVDLVHIWLDSSGASQTALIGDVAAERCATAATPATAEPGCIFVSTVGSGVNRVFIIDAWLFHNGGLRGGY